MSQDSKKEVQHEVQLKKKERGLLKIPNASQQKEAKGKRGL
jgi:hypothetical protein